MHGKRTGSGLLAIVSRRTCCCHEPRRDPQLPVGPCHRERRDVAVARLRRFILPADSTHASNALSWDVNESRTHRYCDCMLSRWASGSRALTSLQARSRRSCPNHPGPLAAIEATTARGTSSTAKAHTPSISHNKTRTAGPGGKRGRGCADKRAACLHLQLIILGQAQKVAALHRQQVVHRRWPNADAHCDQRFLTKYRDIRMSPGSS